MRRTRHAGLRRAIPLMLLLAAVLMGCSATNTDALASERTSAATDRESVGTPATEAEPVTLPQAVGRPVGEARRTLAGIALKTRLVAVRGSACITRGEVLEQRPASGTSVPVKSTITLVVNRAPRAKCGLGLWEPSDLLRRTGGQFAAFARDGTAGLPADTPIALYLGGVRRGVAGRPADRTSWRICPPGSSYAGRVCPFSALDVVSDWPGPLAITGRPPAHPCAHPTPFDARRAGGAVAVTLTPDEELDCTSYWAVQLAVNDVGQIVAANLVLAEP